MIFLVAPIRLKLLLWWCTLKIISFIQYRHLRIYCEIDVILISILFFLCNRVWHFIFLWNHKSFRNHYYFVTLILPHIRKTMKLNMFHCVIGVRKPVAYIFQTISSVHVDFFGFIYSVLIDIICDVCLSVCLSLNLRHNFW